MAHPEKPEKTYELTIEGTIFEWHQPTILPEEIAQLGGWNPADGIIEVDEKTQSEHTLTLGVPVELKPGKGFGKKISWKRGATVIARMGKELDLLRQNYPGVDYQEYDGLHWFLLSGYQAPPPWQPKEIQIAFAVTQGYPNAEPYGFFVPAELHLDGKPPNEHSPKTKPPFGGSWRFLSWAPQRWRATADLLSGDNLWGWARGFVQRLREGQ